MTFNDTPYGSGSPRVIGSPVVPERPALSAQAIIDRSGAANLIVLLRVRMGFPAESFALAARPLIDGYAEFVQLRPIPGSGRYGGPGGQLQRGLVTALRALDHRRGQILPRSAPPEILGALAHRWTYAVFAAALLRDVGG
ncbi:MAG: TraI domain-containing protein, partial [Mycobacterium sp.]